MKSVTIIISHFNSLPFLHACVRQIRKYKHPDIHQHILIVDQSDEATFDIVNHEYGTQVDINVLRTKSLYSGYGIDWVMQKFEPTSDYIVQVHCDLFPIHPNWIHLPITLMEENNLAFCGQLQFISTGKESIYPPYPIFAMAQCFNVGRTKVYREMSFEAGFTRFHNRPWVEEGISWKNKDWDEWAEPAYQERGSDDDIVAFHWQDKYRNDNKLGLAISGFIEPSYGRIIDSLVFHFCSANEARGVMDTMPPLYQEYVKRINENYSDELIDEMITKAKANQPPNLEILSRNYWNGTTKESSPTNEELNKRIEELKK